MFIYQIKWNENIYFTFENYENIFCAVKCCKNIQADMMKISI